MFDGTFDARTGSRRGARTNDRLFFQHLRITRAPALALLFLALGRCDFAESPAAAGLAATVQLAAQGSNRTEPRHLDDR